MRQYLRIALTTGLAIGAVVGALDGLATLSRHVYLTNDALRCLSAPVFPTTVLLTLIAGVLALGLWRLRVPVDRLPAEVSGLLVTGVAVAALAFLWNDVVQQARDAGAATTLFVLAWPPVVLLGIAAGVAVRALVLRSRPAGVRRIFACGAVAGGALAIASVLPALLMARHEARHYLFDTAAGPPRGAGELNVVLISIDTLRADRLASYGGVAGVTPSLDALAADGTAFTAAISQSPWTLPSMASVFTGLTPGRHGVGRSTDALDILARTPLRPDVWSLPAALRDRGLLTQAIITNPYLYPRYGFDHAFEGYENWTLISESLLVLEHTLAFRLLSSFLPKLPLGDVGETVTTRAEAWLARHHDERFFLWLHYLDAHAPYGEPDRHGNKSFRGELLQAARPEHTGDGDPVPHISPARLRAGEVQLDSAQRRALMRAYDAGVHYDDMQVGRILAQLDRLELREHTLVVVVSDHGEEFWEHGGVGHGHSLYDELVRVPLIIRWPGGPVGRQVDDVVRLIDVAPTIIDIATGGPLPAQLEGRSLRPLLEGTPDDLRVAPSEALLFGDERQAVRTQSVKYTRSANGKEELYDLRADPAELRDVGGDGDRLAGARALLDAVVLARPQLPSSRASAPIDVATRQRMRALGYGQ